MARAGIPPGSAIDLLTAFFRDVLTPSEIGCLAVSISIALPFTLPAALARRLRLTLRSGGARADALSCCPTTGERHMSEFLGQLAGSTASLMTALPALLSELLGTAEGATAGSLPVILAQLENAGLGETVRSWVGHDEPRPITAEQVAEAIPLERRTAWAKESGISVEQLDHLLAHILPELTNRASPEGTMSEADAKKLAEKIAHK
jgi:uncharacterized protein YidB (DUF937 family)